MARARKNLPQFLSANTDLKVVHERVQARAALLPSVTYNTQFFYTQGNGTAAPGCELVSSCAPTRLVAFVATRNRKPYETSIFRPRGIFLPPRFNIRKEA